MTVERGSRKERIGTVVSEAMEKTVVVSVATQKPHPLYRKVIRRQDKFKVHDENNEARLGDRVRIMETRKISKSKHWRLAEILERAK
ncbi:MAG: 30S ribosomal protein S17 [Candidatus Dormibacteria bacterium]